MLVAKLFLLKHVKGWETVLFSVLLGSIELGSDDFIVEIPDGSFNLHHLDKQLENGQFQLLVDRLAEGGQWAFGRPKNYGPDSWLLLKEHGTGRLRVLHLRSKAASNPEAFNEAALQAESAKRWEVSAPDSVMLYVTHHHAPKRHRTPPVSIPPKVVVIDPADRDKYYSYCMSFITASLAKRLVWDTKA